MRLTAYIKRKLVPRVAGVQVHYHAAEKVQVSYTIVEMKGSETRISKSETNCASIDDFLSSFDPSVPVWLTLTGRNVITRKLDQDPGEHYLNQLLPNVREDDFTLGLYRTTDASVFVSAVRNDALEILLDHLRKGGIQVFGVSLGPLAVSLLQAQQVLHDEAIEVPGYALQFEQRKLSNIRVSETQSSYEYQVAGELLDSALLVPFASALSYLAIGKGQDELPGNTLPSDERAYRCKKINSWAGYTALALLFVMLLINFLVFSNLNSKHQHLSDQLAYQQSFFSRRDSLRQELSLKTKMIRQMGLADETRLGFCIDRIAATVPKSIHLSAIEYAPLVNKIRSGEALEFNPFIRVEGSSRGSITLNEWIVALKELSWIADVEVLHYEKDGGQGVFTLTISQEKE